MQRLAPDLMSQAIQFRQVMSQPVGTFTPGICRNQLNLISEEYAELNEAFVSAVAHIQNKKARVDCLKELADVVYVAFQFAAAAGWELDEALDRVHISNMSKLVDGKPLKREDGKVLKGPNYKPPYLEDLV
jgi:predicted HAD superfamily Cof-like phosphohydrolase